MLLPRPVPCLEAAEQVLDGLSVMIRTHPPSHAPSLEQEAGSQQVEPALAQQAQESALPLERVLLKPPLWKLQAASLLPPTS